MHARLVPKIILCQKSRGELSRCTIRTGSKHAPSSPRSLRLYIPAATSSPARLRDRARASSSSPAFAGFVPGGWCARSAREFRGRERWVRHCAMIIACTILQRKFWSVAVRTTSLLWCRAKVCPLAFPQPLTPNIDYLRTPLHPIDIRCRKPNLKL